MEALHWLSDHGFGKPIQMVGMVTQEEFDAASREVGALLVTLVRREIPDGATAQRIIDAFGQHLDAMLRADQAAQAALAQRPLEVDARASNADVPVGTPA